MTTPGEGFTIHVTMMDDGRIVARTEFIPPIPPGVDVLNNPPPRAQIAAIMIGALAEAESEAT